jgi:serine/threonine protein kinase
MARSRLHFPVVASGASNSWWPGVGQRRRLDSEQSAPARLTAPEVSRIRRGSGIIDPEGDSDAMSNQTVTAGGGGGSSDDAMPTHVGRYRLIAPLGEGGFGVVYEAEQQYPVQRRVALKIIKAGMDSRAVIARFELERQALARMDHPHIASVLDAGTTDSGRPYFVMELVEGEPICAYCDHHRLPLRERLDLLTQVCSAVQHAHTKGLIHRDLKPGNVLVSATSEGPFARVIDFGIAKAMGLRAADDVSLTGHLEMIGTPLYMSPEQAEGNPDIDTRTDIYALGVILYELLTGTTPVAPELLRAAAYAEIQRIIREHEPPLPSARVAAAHTDRDSISALRSTRHDELQRSIRGELDWIAMKALDKERGRRYESAAAFASDLRRYLDGDAVLAAPPGRAYQLGKFVRRHRVLASAGAAVTLALVVGLAGTLWQARQASQRAAELQKVADFQAAMLESIDPAAAGRLLVDELSRQHAAASADTDPDFLTTLKRLNTTDASIVLLDGMVLKPAVKAIEERFPDQPLVQAGLRSSLGEVYFSLGRYDEARVLIEQAVAIRRRELGESALETIIAENQLAFTLADASQLDEAEALLRPLLQRIPDAGDRYRLERAAALRALGLVMTERGDHANGELLFREALLLREQILGADHEETINLLGDVGLARWKQADAVSAEGLWRDALARARRGLGPEHPTTLTMIGNLAVAIRSQQRSDEAELLYREALALNRRVRGDSHPVTLSTIGNLGVLLEAKGDLVGAEAFYVERYTRSLEVLGPDHFSTLLATHNLGYLRRKQDRLVEAVALFRTALEGRERLLGRENEGTLSSLSSLGNTERQLQRWEDSERTLKEAVSRHERVFGRDHDESLGAYFDLALLYRDQKRYAEVEPLARQAYEGRLQRQGLADETTRIYGVELAVSLAMTERAAAAETIAHALLGGTENAADWPAHEPRLPLALALAMQGRHAEAEAELGRLAGALDAGGPNGLKRLVSEAYETIYLGWQHNPPADLDARRQAARTRWQAAESNGGG